MRSRTTRGVGELAQPVRGLRRGREVGGHGIARLAQRLDPIDPEPALLAHAVVERLQVPVAAVADDGHRIDHPLRTARPGWRRSR